MAPRKRLRLPHKIVQIAVANLIRNALDLGGGTSDVLSSNREVRVELPRGAPYGVRQGADVVGAGRLPIIYCAPEFIRRLGGDVLRCVDKI